MTLVNVSTESPRVHSECTQPQAHNGRSHRTLARWCEALGLLSLGLSLAACSVSGQRRTGDREGPRPLGRVIDSAAARESGYVARFASWSEAKAHGDLIESYGGRVRQLDAQGRVLRVDPAAAGRVEDVGAIALPEGAVALVDSWVRPVAATDGDGSEDTSFAQNLLAAREVVGVEALRSRYPAADGRSETIAILDTGLDFGTPGLSWFSDGSRKVMGFYDLTGFGFVNLERVSEAEGASLSIDGIQYVFGSLPPAVRVLAKGMLSEERLAQDTIEPDGIDLNGNGERNNLFGIALVQTGADLVLWVDANADRVFADRGPGRHEIEHMTDFNGTGSFLDMRATVSGSGHPLAVTLPSVADLASTAAIKVQFHAVIGDHGTACASIAAGEKYVDGRIDGMAPKARLLSFALDPTGRDVYRASTLIEQFLTARDKGATAISVSWGFATADLASAQAFAEILDQEVASKNIVIGLAAGNSGPGSLSAAPNDYIPRLGFALGAAVTEKQSRNVYGWLGVKGNQIVHYSSVGPTRNGRAMPDLVSPLMTLALSRRTGGESNAYIPFGGTSSATPAFVGAVAALTSALRSQGLPIYIGVLKDALLLSARRLDGAVPADRQGVGLVDVNAAFDVYRELVGNVTAGERVDYSLIPAVRVDNPVPAGSNPARAPEGFVSNEFIAQFRIGLTPVFRDDPALVPGEIGSFAAPLKVVVVYDDNKVAPWLEVPEAVIVQANGGTMPVRVHSRLRDREGLFSAEVRFVDEDGSLRLRVPVRLALPARSAADGQIMTEEGKLSPFQVLRQPLVVDETRSLELKGSFLTDAGVKDGRVVVALYDADGHSVFRQAVGLGGAVTTLNVSTPALPPGHYEVLLFQQPGYVVSDVRFILGVSHVPFDLVQETAQNGLIRLYVRNKSALKIDRAVVTTFGREESVELVASAGRTKDEGSLREFPAFRGSLSLDASESRASWAVALVQTPVERLLRPFYELAVAYTESGSSRPLAWEWTPVSGAVVGDSLVWQQIAAAQRGGGDSDGDPAPSGTSIDVEAYPNVGRFEKISAAPLRLRVRTKWRDPSQVAFHRDSRLDQDWLLPDFDRSRLVAGPAARHVYGEVALYSGDLRLGAVPLTLSSSGGLE